MTTPSSCRHMATFVMKNETDLKRGRAIKIDCCAHVHLKQHMHVKMRQLMSMHRCSQRSVCKDARNSTCIATSAQRTRFVRVKANQNESGGTQETGAGLKAVWYAAEAVGKLAGKGNTSDSKTTSSVGTMTRQEMLSSIREDYDKNYFVSGAGDMLAYADNCTFADPFVSFKGTDRFKQNVSNLGGYMRDIRLDVYEFNELSQDRIETKWRFSCVLDLPWKPLLAAAGSTIHVMDLQKGKVVEHIEKWDVEPSKVVSQLFRPARKMPSNAWEVFMLSASEGDGLGMWLATSPLFLKVCAPVVGVSLLCKLFTGEGLPGVFLGSVEGISWLLVVAAAGTEVYKLAKSLGGGESG